MSGMELCCHKECEESVEAVRMSRCGGVLFGTRDDPGWGCGRFHCDGHLFGKGRGPFYCEVCLAAKRLSQET